VIEEQWQLAFVDSIAAAPTIRLTIHSGPAGPWILRDGSRFDPPPLRRSIPQSLLADGAAPTSAAYDNRTISLRLQLHDRGTQMDADPAATHLQALMRELDRPTNILKLQAGTSAPVFFRTYRSGPDTIDWDPVNREATMSILAEPAALGLEEVLSGVVVTNDPAAAANGLFLDITAPKGDVETPLFLTVSNGVVGTGRRRSAISVRRRGTPSATPLFLQAESMSLATNVTLPGADATMSGAGSNYARISYTGTTALVQRLSTTTRFPSTASIDARGTYRAFVRVKQNTGTDVHTMRLRHGGADVQITNATVTLPQDVGAGAPTRKLIDLGIVQIPTGYDPVERGMSGVELATEGVFLAIDAGRTSGSGTLDVDYLMLLPVDDLARAMFIDWPANATVTDFVVEGGTSPSVYARNASGQVTSTQAVEIAGLGPMITPGVTNRVFFHRDVGTGTSSTGSGDSVTATTTLTPSYFPRYVGGFRPATT
jgi:hypothetical protein